MSNFQIGDIVTLKSHPYSHNLTSIIISGEPQLVPPLMVVTEVLLEVNDQYDEKRGEIVVSKGDSQCKCLWYSGKSNQFEETWIKSILLKVIQSQINTLNDENFEAIKNLFLNKQVAFKTIELELGKRKSSISIEGSSTTNGRDKNTINPLLSFVAPSMQVIQVIQQKIDEQKEPLFDIKTGKRKRIVPNISVKCKWYGTNDKLSERIIPIEAIIKLPEIKYEFLEQATEKIGALGSYRYKSTIIQPVNLFNASGFYYLKGYDYLKNANIDIKIIETSDFVDIDSYYDVTAPEFELEDGEVLGDNYFLNQLTAAIKIGLDNKKHLRISYIDQDGVHSYRTIKDYKIINVSEGGDSIKYLKGFCLSRRADRHFRLDRIRKLQILDIKY